VGRRADLDVRKISSPPGFDPGPSSPKSVAIPTELPGPHIYNMVSKFRRLRPHSSNGLMWTLDPEPFLPSSQRLKCSCKLEAHIIS